MAGNLEKNKAVDPQILENLDLLLNLETLESEESWDTLSDIEDVETEAAKGANDDET